MNAVKTLRQAAELNAQWFLSTYGQKLHAVVGDRIYSACGRYVDRRRTDEDNESDTRQRCKRCETLMAKKS
jgi:hypothetical protein